MVSEAKCTLVIQAETWMTEHQYAVKKNMKNGIAAHACQHQHSVDWDAAKVRCTEQQIWKRRVLEAIYMQQHP